MMYHLFQNSIWKVVKIAKTSDITLVGDTYFLPPLYYNVHCIGGNALEYIGTLRQGACHTIKVHTSYHAASQPHYESPRLSPH